MTILQTNRLTEEQLLEIHELDRISAEADSAKNRISLDNGINYVPGMDSFFLLYEEDALVGLISIFAPMQDVAEISACVHPGYRQQGYFRRLLERACTSLIGHGYNRLLLVHEAAAQAGKAIAQKWGLKIEHSEYLLHYAGGIQTPDNDNLEVRYAQESDMAEMAQLSSETFGETIEEARHLVESAFRDETRHNFVVVMDGAMVGIGGVNTSDPELYIFGLGISPQHQNKGLGRIMLAKIISVLQKTYSREIVLEVDSENARAFHLYTTAGFEVRTQYDYYEARTAAYIAQ